MRSKWVAIVLSAVFSLFILTIPIHEGIGQEEQGDDLRLEDTLERDILPEGLEEVEPEEEPEALPPEAEAPAEPEEEEELPEEGPEPPPTEERVEGGEPREGETRYAVGITGMVAMNYVFSDSTDTFTVRYRWEIKGEANAATAVIRGDIDIDAEVEGFLSKWPTGQCNLEITIPKVPFELTFKKSEEEKGSIKLIFRRAINETWQSKCTFTDAPGARFDTHGPPERWLTRALEKARPPLKSIVVDIGTEETTTPLVISKEIIDDPPLGTMEIEGTASITVTPGG